MWRSAQGPLDAYDLPGPLDAEMASVVSESGLWHAVTLSMILRVLCCVSTREALLETITIQPNGPSNVSQAC